MHAAMPTVAQPLEHALPALGRQLGALGKVPKAQLLQECSQAPVLGLPGPGGAAASQRAEAAGRSYGALK